MGKGIRKLLQLEVLFAEALGPQRRRCARFPPQRIVAVFFAFSVFHLESQNAQRLIFTGSSVLPAIPAAWLYIRPEKGLFLFSQHDTASQEIDRFAIIFNAEGETALR